MPVAFDVVAVLWKEGQEPEIRLIADAFDKADKGCLPLHTVKIGA